MLMQMAPGASLQAWRATADATAKAPPEWGCSALFWSCHRPSYVKPLST